MNRSSRLITIIAVLAMVGPVFDSQVSAQPNVIVIVADDAGYADWGFMNGVSGSGASPTDIPTPNLDALANRGVKFSRAYVCQSCQPTRAALVTGGYQNRIGNEVVGNNYYLATQGFAPDGVPEGVPAASTTIWERMKSVGYSTGAVGKWHLGQIEEAPLLLGNRPEHQGIDEFYGIWHGSRSYNVGGLGGHPTQRLRETTVDSFGNVTDFNAESAHSGEYITNTFGQYAVDFIGDHHADADPFFLYQSFTAPHTPLQNSPDFNDPSIAGLSGTRKTYASMMLTMDKEIGRILAKLDDPDDNPLTSDSITDDTLIVFINDNGGADAQSSSPNGADNGILRRGKGSPYEGGIRVPMIIAGAGVNAAVEGTTYDAPVHGVDILPTVFAAGGGSLVGETGIDGVNLLPHINGTDTSDPHEVIAHRHRKQFALIKGDWKLVSSGGSSTNNHQLFNLATDISETNNVKAANAALVEELSRDLTAYEAVFDKQRFEILNQTSEQTINIFDHFTFRPGVQTNWSGSGAWVEGGTATVETMFNSDAFAGAVLEFTTASSNYTANNNIIRETGMEYMLNQIVLSGTGTANQTGTIQGNDLLFTNSLSGAGPQIAIDASNGPGGNGNAAIVIGGATGNGNFNAGGGGTDGGAQTYDATANWFNAQGAETINFTNSSQMGGSSDPDNATTMRGGMPFQSRTQVNDTGYTIVEAGQVFSLSYDFGAGGGLANWTGDENMRTFLFTATAPVDGNLTVGDMTEIAADTYDIDRANDGQWTTRSVATMYTTTAADIGKTVYFGMQFLDPAGPTLFPRIDGVNLQVTGPAAPADSAFDIDLDLIMYDDLSVTGDGDVEVNINGQIKDYFEARSLTKTGTSTVTLRGDNTYAGDTTITGGALALAGSGALSNTPTIEVQTGATFDVSGTTAGGMTLGLGQTLKGSGDVVGEITAALGSTVAPGSSAGLLKITGDCDLETGSFLEIELGGAATAGTDYDQLCVTGNLDLQGDLVVSFLPGFTPQANDSFQVLDYATRTGNFDNVVLPPLAGGLLWDPDLPNGLLGVVLLGDANGDGVVNSFDISWFGMASFNRPMYLAMFPDIDPDVVLDMNNDGVFNSFDIADFAAALGF